MNREEINQIKVMITNICETNSKVSQILQEREAIKKADEKQRRQINELEDNFQRLERCSQTGDVQFKELERTVRDLLPRVDQAVSLVRNYTQNRNKERNRCISGDLGTTTRKRSNGQQHKGPALIPQRRNSNTTGLNGQNETLLESNIDSLGCSMEMKNGFRSENENKDPNVHGNDSGNRSHTAPVNDTGYKRRLTEEEVDNRLRYSRRTQMGERGAKPAADSSKKEKKGEGNPAVDVSGAIIDVLKDENAFGCLKDEIARQSETVTKGVEGADGLDMASLFSSGLEETLRLVCEDKDIIQQFTNQEGGMSTDAMLKDTMAIPTYIDEIASKAEIERLKGAGVPRGVGPDTVLCLDTSGSMAGAPFQEMISLAIKFVDGICQVSQAHGIEENIGVCTFGKKTGVPLHLTNQYDKVKDVLLSLQAEGPSPLFSGIQMAIAACEGNGRTVTMSGIPVGSRIILISDGKATPDHWHLIGDNVDPNNGMAKLVVNNYMVAASHLVQSFGHTIYTIPVGYYINWPLERVARLSGGRLIERNELDLLINFAQYQSAAASYVNECKDLGEEVDREPFLRAMIDVESTSPGEPKIDSKKMEIFGLALKFAKRLARGTGDSDEKGDVMVEVNTYMPCIGTRVRRGPNWKWGDQDGGGPGTVVGHNTQFMVWVEWDLDGIRNVYNYFPGVHDVTVVDDERVLAAHEEIAVGCKVKRGKDWNFGNQDGGEGTVGVVCRVHPDKTIHVRWPNKTLEKYDFGADGRFDVELIVQRKPGVIPSILPPRSKEGSSQGATRKEMSVEEMNRLNQRK